MRQDERVETRVPVGKRFIDGKAQLERTYCTAVEGCGSRVVGGVRESLTHHAPPSALYPQLPSTLYPLPSSPRADGSRPESIPSSPGRPIRRIRTRGRAQ